jgi:hypothetical protein
MQKDAMSFFEIHLLCRFRVQTRSSRLASQPASSSPAKSDKLRGWHGANRAVPAAARVGAVRTTPKLSGKQIRCNDYVTVDFWQQANGVLDSIFDVDHDSDLKNGRFLCRF